ncbi:MAG: UDP-N-acetylglucosamine 4,6-dehydratase (inverting) [Proteobacteria bacterium]|nr:UDP-N-acetylglucosamine 4,6-dehydratase (inverting) [Pseudomonadota bacterium]MBU1715798.1 UDP-N-acetylglucosamine 4,6-dehydratase (inverting) [Pseudomonadota bacterium]
MSIKIKDVSLELGVPVSTVRYWQAMFDDYIRPIRTDGGQRRYSAQHVKRFHQIMELVYVQKMPIEQARQRLLKGEGESDGIDWNKQSILLTGGTGSFGKHFCRLMLKKYNPKVIRIYSRDELKQHEMRIEFKDDKRLRFFIGDVRDGERLQRAMSGIDYVVHAAALKQVPACEYNPFEAVKTNIHGAQNVINAAIDAGVKKVIALSTDKAVNPVNLYGATKLCSDKLFVQGNAYAGASGTRFSCVRYGNVIGSRGSVIPVFLQQKESGTITITDERMTRFWITLDQAVELVLKGFRYMEGGEIFVPNIPSMRLMDLAKAIAPECEIKHIGIREGEKLHEALTGEDEGRNTFKFKNMYVIMPSYSWWQRKNYVDAVKMAEGFVYTSDANEEWMTIEDLQQIVFGPEMPSEVEDQPSRLIANS